MNEVTIIVPTYNEQASIGCLLQEIEKVCAHHVLVVDDGNDDTEKIARLFGAEVLRGQRKGLGQAIIDGINHARTPIVMVMDADLSHPPRFIPSLLEPIMKHGYDMTIGSRYVGGGDFSNWSKKRQLQSLIGVKLMQLVTGVRDSNSGFFAFRKSILEGVELKPSSWKIMLEVLFKGKLLSKKEVPITFVDRVGGESKNSNRERLRHAKHLLGLLVYKFPKRYISFALIGGLGSLTHFALLWFVTERLHVWYGFSFFVAMTVAMLQNYTLNHLITFRKEKHFNPNHFKGVVKYLGGSWVGELVEWAVMVFLTEAFGIWYILGNFIGTGFSSVIKYLFFKKHIWAKGKSFIDADYEWHSFFKGMPWQRFSKQKIASTVCRLVPDAGVVVDVGCGSSPLGVMVNHADYIGVDLNEAKVSYMNAKQLDHAKFMVGDVMSLPFHDGFADTVLFIETVEHLDSEINVRRALAEITRITKRGGRVVIAMPDFESGAGRLMERLYKVFHPQAYADDHKMKLSTLALVKFCSQYGLYIERVVSLYKRDFVLKFKKHDKHGEVRFNRNLNAKV